MPSDPRIKEQDKKKASKNPYRPRDVNVREADKQLAILKEQVSRVELGYNFNSGRRRLLRRVQSDSEFLNRH